MSQPVLNGLPYLVAALGVFVIAIGIVTHPRSERLKAWFVGAAAGFDFLQIAHVHVFTIVTVLWLVSSHGFWRRRIPAATFGMLVGALVLAATPFFGSLAISHTLSLQLAGLAITAAIIALNATPDAVRNMMLGFLTICVASAAWSIFQKYGIAPTPASATAQGAGRVSGLYREPDWLGLFAAAGILTTFHLDLPLPRRAGCLVILAFGLLYAQARAGLIAIIIVGVVAAVLSVLSRRPERRYSNRQLIAVFVVAAAIVGIASPAAVNTLGDRLQSGFSSTPDVGARARQLQLASLEVLARSAPWHGDGLSAAGRVDVHGAIEYGAVPSTADSVSTDWILGWWVDGKYLAVPLIATLILLAVINARRYSGQLLGIVLITSLVSDGVMIPITWFAVGLCLVAHRRKLVVAAEPAAHPEAAPAGSMVTA